MGLLKDPIARMPGSTSTHVSTANAVERLFTVHSVPAWRELQARGELLSVTLARSEVADDQYDLITHRASKEAHDRNEDSFMAEVYALAVACYLAALPTKRI